MSFQVNPLTDDLIVIKNATAIARSLRNLVLTTPGERFFNENMGSQVNNLLFENVDDVTAMSIRTDTDEYNIDVTLSYQIIGINIPIQELSFVLIPTR